LWIPSTLSWVSFLLVFQFFHLPVFMCPPPIFSNLQLSSSILYFWCCIFISSIYFHVDIHGFHL
jgi:hypothetical protein